MANAQLGFLAMGSIGLHGPSVPSCDVLSSSQQPIYLKYDELASGTFGTVHKVVDASTRDEFAGKDFPHKTGWEREVEIMKRLSHENIVKFIDFRPRPKPLLVMEYLPPSNLKDRNAGSPTAVEEMMVLMSQGLSALAYVHDNNITHRDLKSENFLVSSQLPFSVKLCDFGLAQDKSVLQTFCGSAQYLAPEVFDNSSYTNSVDVWSLAVILLEYIYGWPRGQQLPNRKREPRAWGRGWCQCLVNATQDWDSEPLIDFLTTHMLKLDPHKRLPTSACLSQASELDLFDEVFSKTGHLKPKQQPVLDVGDIYDEEQSTILISRLWEHDSRNTLRRGESAAQWQHISQTASMQ